MKIIHISDLHLNSRIEKLSSEKSKKRREELILTFERLVEYAKENSVKAIIISGDMFDTTKTTSGVFDRVLHTISMNKNIDFFYLKGNHDEDSFISYLEVKPDNLIVFNSKWSYYAYDNIVICGISLSNENNKLVYEDLKLDSDKINIVSMHGQVAGYKNNEDAEIISIPLLKDKNIDYLALGHYHSFADGIIDGRGRYIYSGCLEGRGFDETGKKGFVLIDINEKISYQFVPFASRELYEEKFDVNKETSFLSLREKIIFTLKNKYETKNLIKVTLFGEHKADFDIDPYSIEAKLNDMFYFVKVVDETSLKVDIADYEVDKSFKGEFIRTVFSSELNEEEKSEIIAKGLKALKGEL